jgi:CRP-like cAMP-binding protein
MRKKLVIQSGARTNSIGNSIRNKILLWIPDNEYLIIRPHLEYLKLPSRLSLRESSEPVKFLYFPNAGLISLIVTMHDGRTVEAGVIGREGALGVALAVGLNKCPVGEKVQIAGDGFKVRASVVQNILKSTPQLLMVLNRCAVVRGMLAAQTVACNRLHRIDQRLARWLLRAQDRVDSSSLAVTHGFLATMLGTNRPTVSSAAAILQKRKCIEYMRGGVKILDRRKLEASSCECYEVMRQFDSELIPS